MKKILILMSDTGGGHRAVAHAIRDAIAIRFPDQAQVEIVDGLREYTPAPFKYAPEMYPIWIAHGKATWRLSFYMTNSKLSAQSVNRTAYLTLERYFKQMLRDHEADVIVSVHLLLISPVMDALLSFKDRPPFVTVVTDLASTHLFWYDPRVDRLLVPTPPTFERGLEVGISPELMRVTGLPVSPSFADLLVPQAEARQKLGWLTDKLTVLMLGGGEGMGPLYRMARAINDQQLDIQLVVVAGKNKSLKHKLESVAWDQPTWIYPFTREMPLLMSAADMIVTKAGAASISEAITAGLPLIISDVIPGQETGNMQYIVQNGAGAYPGSPEEVGRTVAKWVAEGRDKLRERAEAARRIAVPDAAYVVADEIMQQAQRERIPTQRRNLLQTLGNLRHHLIP
jgi:1,2-diacylglycerol 3-beta-galactosyltransferase